MKAMTKHLIPRASVLLIVSLLLLTQMAAANLQAESPQLEATAQPLISYQGTLTDQNGNPVNATVTMKFALYDASSGGNLKWGAETQSVQVSDGLFHVLLGSVTPIDPAKLTGDLWLDIIVNNEHLAPRERVAGATYAVAGMADPFPVPGRLVIGPGALSEPLQVKASWSVLGLDTLAGGQDAGVRFYENGVAQWFLLNDASEGNQLHLGSNGAVAFTLSQHGDMDLYRSLNLVGGNLTASGRGFFEGATYGEGAVNVQDIGVPLTFKESDQSGQGSLWRTVLDAKNLRFDSSDNGTDFVAYHTPITMYPNGGVGCGAITENNLQTPEEQAAGGSDRFEEGDLLCWSAEGQRLEKCATPNDPLVQAVADKGGRPIVIGAELVKVVGPVHAGDYLVASSVPGYAIASSIPSLGSSSPRR